MSTIKLWFLEMLLSIKGTATLHYQNDFKLGYKKRSVSGYLEFSRQLVRGEDTQFDLRKADLQILKVVPFVRSSVLVGLVTEVFIQLLQLWIRIKMISFAVSLLPLLTMMLKQRPTSICLSISNETEQLEQQLLLNYDSEATSCHHQVLRIYHGYIFSHKILVQQSYMFSKKKYQD